MLVEVNALDSFELTPEDIEALGGNESQITTIKVWDPASPEGWLKVALSPTSARVVCPKPCG